MNRSRVAVVMTASTALALGTTLPASAHDTERVSPTLRYGPVFDRHAFFQALATEELGELLAKATAAHARAAAVPNDTVLTGRARAAAIREYRHAVRLDKALGTLTGLSAAQAAVVSQIQAQLSATAAELKALLANRPTAEPVKVVQSDRVVSATSTDPGTFGRCDHDRFSDRRSGFSRGDYRWRA